MTTNETPNQRRTRLIEQYVPVYLQKEFPGTHQNIILMLAETMADAVIAATPQEPQADYDGITKEAQAFMSDQFRKDKDIERYPTDIEIRLVELVKFCTQCVSNSRQINYILTQLSVIESDMQGRV